MDDATTTARRARSDRKERLAYFDGAARYTRYLGTPAGDGLFLVKTADKDIGRSLFSKRGRGEMRVLARAVDAIEGLLGPCAIAKTGFVDVGANIGTTTVPALLSHGFETAVAIEPEPENVRLLRLNLLLNDLEDRVTVLPLAASNAVGFSELVVDPSRAGKHWIATDRSKLPRKHRGEGALLNVETVTLDHLVATGVLDPERTGLVWMDAQAHEGHILEGASSLLGRGVPLVLEWHPGILDRFGDRGKVERAIAGDYTHFATMHRNHNPSEPSFPLMPADDLPAYAARFVDRSMTKTDILVLRLAPEQAAGVVDLDAFLTQGSDDDEERDWGPGDRRLRRLGPRIRSRLTRRRSRP